MFNIHSSHFFSYMCLPYPDFKPISHSFTFYLFYQALVVVLTCNFFEALRPGVTGIRLCYELFIVVVVGVVMNLKVAFRIVITSLLNKRIKSCSCRNSL